MGIADATRLILRIAAFLPLIAAIVVGDWASMLPSVQRWRMRPLDPIVDTLLGGRTVWADPDWPALKAAMVLRMPSAPDVLVLGGSRTMQIQADWFLPRSMFNGSVPNGDVEDMASMFQVHVQGGKLPREVLLELSPSLGHDTAARTSSPLGAYLLHALIGYRIIPPLERWPEVFLQGIKRNTSLMYVPYWELTGRLQTPACRWVRPDGTWFKGPQPTPEEIELQVRREATRIDAGFLQWRTNSQPDAFHLKLLHSLLDDLQRRGIRVRVMLPPLHPVAYRNYHARGGYDETWIRREMAARGIEVVGSYNPDSCGATPGEFYDDVHPAPPVLRRILANAGVIASP